MAQTDHAEHGQHVAIVMLMTVITALLIGKERKAEITIVSAMLRDVIIQQLT